jgi:hypothetical protein
MGDPTRPQKWAEQHNFGIRIFDAQHHSWSKACVLHKIKVVYDYILVSVVCHNREIGIYDKADYLDYEFYN